MAMKPQQTPSPKKHTPPSERLHIDFEDSLSVKDQLIVLGVVLIVSLILFGVIYGLLRLHNAAPSQAADTEVPPPSTVSQQILPSVPSEPTPDKASSAPSAVSEPSKASEPSESSEPSETSDTSDTSEASEPSDSSETSDTSDTSESSDTSETSKEPEPSDDTDTPASCLGTTDTVTMTADDSHIGHLMLVNKTHPCFTDGEQMYTLADTPERHYTLSDYTVKLHEEAAPSFEVLMNDFYDLYGDTDIMVACGYRSADVQSNLYDNEINAIGQEEAQQWVAPPGYSEHQSGYAFDLDLNITTEDDTGNLRYDNTPPYSWINDNCWRYGFIVRYPPDKADITGFQYESWHFRYVGYPSACYIVQTGLALEEYLALVQSHPISDPLMITTDQADYAVYYVPTSDGYLTELSVPEHHPYTISGDNDGGFIVTVALVDLPADEPSADDEPATDDTPSTDDEPSAEENLPLTDLNLPPELTQPIA